MATCGFDELYNDIGEHVDMLWRVVRGEGGGGVMMLCILGRSKKVWFVLFQSS